MSPPFITALVTRDDQPLDCVIHFQVLPYYPGSRDYDVSITGMEVDACHDDEHSLTFAEQITLHNLFWDDHWHRVCAAAEAWLAAMREDVAQVRADDARNEMGAAA